MVAAPFSDRIAQIHALALPAWRRDAPIVKDGESAIERKSLRYTDDPFYETFD